MYIETRKRKGGSYVNEEARIIGEQIELHMTQCNESEASPDDIIGKLFGPEHSGRVRCLGMGAAPSNTFRNTKRLSNLSVSSSNPGASSSTDNTYLHQKVSRLECQLEGTLNALKTNMISKEGSFPDEFVGLFAPQPQPSNAESEPTSPVDVRGSSDGSNANDQENT
ncbi:uncharacterized protein LOC132032517 [Lycium ferocissimum]|uniref:uncharacterized protein LOC132032517 n=1 Tax=Lycium ferocissimum TaxID=112874 RepID=UPI00281677FF|nr:uncharacterized protein LOC132032517 [Lycium ferocissimum]XP_059278131.1 uncharacterized protein LOC132032517 [Lycium ferocissimum]XP_059278132.1 uncharacterized protein LOC132032517 [Lycium ferocissimum]